MVEHRTFRSRRPGSKPPPPFRSLGNFVYPTLHVSFGRDSKSCWSLLSGAYSRGSKRPHTGKWKIPAVDSIIIEKENSENKPLLC